MAQRRRTVLLMWEYACDHSPVWARSPDLEIGPIDVRELGVDDALRDDLADWNRRVEVAANPDDVLEQYEGPAWWNAVRAEAFGLAARLQRALGSGWTVWCLGGEGDGFTTGPEAVRCFRTTDGRAQLVLLAAGLAAFTAATAKHPRSEVPPALQAAVRAWSAAADRVAQPGFEGPGGIVPAEHRAQGLDLCGRLQAVLPGARLLWFGGGPVPE